MREAGLVGADGQPKVPSSGAELVAMAKQIAKGDTFGFAIGGAQYRAVHLRVPSDALAERREHLRPDLKRAGVTEPAAVEAAEFWGSFHAQHKVAPPANTNARDAFIAGKLGIWLAGSWNFTGLRAAKMEFTVAPVPRLLEAARRLDDPAPVRVPEAQGADAASETPS